MQKITLIFYLLVLSFGAQAQITATGFAGFIDYMPGPDPYVPGVDITIEQLQTGDQCNVVSTATNFYQCVLPQNIDGPLKVTATKDQFWLDGVTSFDLLRIQWHILQLQPILEPESQIAADANNSGGISTLDMVFLRKLILFVIPELTFTDPWRFLPTWTVINVKGNITNGDVDFQEHWSDVSGDPYNITPFNYDAPFGLENFEYPAYLDVPLEFFWLSTNNQFDLSYFSFNAIKVGDINFSNSQMLMSNDADTREVKPAVVVSDPGLIKRGERLTVPVTLGGLGGTVAWQFGLWLSPDDFELLDIEAGDLSGFTKENFGLTELDEGKIRALWFAERPDAVPDFNSEQVLFNLVVEAKRNVLNLSESMRIDEDIMLSEAYNATGQPTGLDLTISQAAANTFEQAIQLMDQYPNPVQDQLTLEVLLEQDANLDIEVVDLLGNRSRAYTHAGTKGLNRVVLDQLNALANGTYLIRIMTADGQLTSSQFIKMD